MESRGGSIWLAALLAGCTVSSGAGHPDASSAATTASAAPSAPVAASASGSSQLADEDAPPTDWRQAARMFQWRHAYQLLLALDEPERKKARTRLAIGRVALMAGEHAAAVTALEGLETQLPLAREEILDWYAQAAAQVGPYDKAAQLLQRSPKVANLMAATRALQRGGDLKKARELADRAVKLAQRTRRKSDEGDAHLLRAMIAEQAGNKAVAAADFGWIVRNRPAHLQVREAIAGIDRVGGVLSIEQRVTGMSKSATQLNLDTTLATLDALADKHKQHAAAIALGRGRACYHARVYDKAREALDKAALVALPYAAEARYYAARATARLGLEEQAVERYEVVAQRYPKSGWAERAAYRRAELLLNMGQFGHAATAFTRYLSRFGKSSYAERARYGRAMALLSGGSPKQAKKILSTMRDKAGRWREKANLQHLEGVAAMRSGDLVTARKLWLALVAERPLTWSALAAHARLQAMGHKPLPVLIGKSRAVPYAPLPLALPGAPALFHSLGLDAVAEQRLARVEQETARIYPGRESEALCELYGKLSGARRRHQVGSRAVSLAQLMRPPTNAERWAWRCVYPLPYADLVGRAERRQSLPAGFVHAIMRQESAFKTTAVSPVGARGLMQLMPNTAARVAQEMSRTPMPDQVVRPDVNVELGSFYLAKLMRNFGGNLPLAAAAYNAGPQAVQRWLNSPADRELDMWVARIPYRETRHYVQRVVGNYSRYQWLQGGAAAVTPLSLSIPADTDIGEDAY